MAKGLPKSLKKAGATSSTAGVVKKGVHVPNAVAAPTKAEFDALLTALKNAGLMETA